jgi:V8-like Glu-specific endopeptidase
MITIPSSVSTALASSRYRTALLVHLPGTGFKVTDNHKPITYNSTTYATSGEIILKTSNINRTTEIAANSYTLTFAGADRSAYQEYTNLGTDYARYVGQTGTLYLAFLDDNYELLDSGSVLELYTGVIDTWDLTETKTTSEFSVKLTSHWASFEVTNGRFTNSASQQEYYPGDDFFKYSHQEDIPLKWGS